MVASDQVLATGAQIDTLCINTIRTLAIDAVQQANSGHPRAPMGLASVTYCLWQESLRYDPADPTWLNRDRFVLSAAHASILLYSLVHLAGVRDFPEHAHILAGHLKLSNLCWIYNNNHVTLDGPASWSFSEDVMTRFIGYGWNVTRVADANDVDLLTRAYNTFLKTTDRPTLIVVDSHIGYGS